MDKDIVAVSGLVGIVFLIIIIGMFVSDDTDSGVVTDHDVERGVSVLDAFEDPTDMDPYVTLTGSGTTDHSIGDGARLTRTSECAAPVDSSALGLRFDRDDAGIGTIHAERRFSRVYDGAIMLDFWMKSPSTPSSHSYILGLGDGSASVSESDSRNVLVQFDFSEYRIIARPPGDPIVVVPDFFPNTWYHVTLVSHINDTRGQNSFDVKVTSEQGTVLGCVYDIPWLKEGSGMEYVVFAMNTPSPTTMCVDEVHVLSGIGLDISCG